jgi:predicted nucleic acid-binding protein
MRFWDSSAIVPLCFRESTSDAMRRIAKTDEDMVVWWATRIECISAMARRRREGVLATEADRKARAILSVLSGEWSEVQSSEIVRERAERLLMIHPLRAADGLQLAAALVWAEESPKGLEVVCLDHNLREAALREGFTVLP